MTFSFFEIKYLYEKRGKVGFGVTEKELALVFKALSDENRIRIVNYLWDGEKSARRLLAMMDISQSTLSHHMKILCECGIVNDRKEGKWHHYSLNSETLHGFKSFIETLSCVEKGDDCC